MSKTVKREVDIVTNIFEDLLGTGTEQIAIIHDTYASDVVREAVEALIAWGADEYQVNCICTNKVYIEEGSQKACSCGIGIVAECGKVFSVSWTGTGYRREPLEVWHG